MNDAIRPLRTADDYAAALEEIDRLVGTAPEGGPDSDRLAVLGVLAADYEDRILKLEPAAPFDVVMLDMRLKGRSQADLAGVLGSRSRASELIAGRRALTPAMADRVADAWDIPRDLLGPATAASRSPAQRAARTLGAAAAVAVALGAAALGYRAWALHDLPSIEPLVAAAEDPDRMPLDAAPLFVRQAFLAAEDSEFYRHDGTSARGLARASVDNIASVVSGRPLSGGSTITHQLVKITLLRGEGRTLRRKLRQMALAERVEAALEKDQILELYLNKLYFGGDPRNGDVIGLAAATEYYFDVAPAELTTAQAALLAAMPAMPNAVRVDRPANAERAYARREWVLARMETEGYVTAEARAEARAASLR